MKVGITSWCFRWATGTRDVRPAQPLTPFTLLDKAAALGAEVVQICDNMPLDRLDEASLRRLGEEARARGIILEVGTACTQSEHLLRYVQIARLTGARLARVVEDMQLWQPTLSDIADHIRRVLPVCRDAGITIGIENHFRLDSADLRRLVEDIGDPHVGIVLDTLNSIVRIEGWREVVHNLAPYTVSLHAKDAITERRGVGFFVTGCTLGKGRVDFPYVIQSLRAAGRDCHALVEAWIEKAEDEEATLRLEQTVIAESLDYLRRVVAG